MSKLDTNNWQYLIQQYLDNKISREEFEYLLKNVESRNDLSDLMPVLKNKWDESFEISAADRIKWDAKFDTMMQEFATKESTEIKSIGGSRKKKGSLKKIYRLAAASIILFIFCGGIYFLINNFNKQKRSDQVLAKVVKADVQPGSNGAILILSDGKQIVLDSTGSGTLAIENNTHIIKKEGQVAYESSEKISDVPLAFNTMITPRGKEYQLILPDGSKVWLNAASSITFPTAFTEKERKVSISGEAYFEVVHIDKHNGKGTVPFIVTINSNNGESTEIEVLGTHFNVNAYDDEMALKTTLLEGAVRVNKNLKTTFLNPGQQAQVFDNGEIKLIKNANVSEAVAWKNGRFDCSNMDIEMIMRQVARWYDVEIEYASKIKERYTVNMLRNIPVSNLLKFLELSGGVSFKIEGKKITVMQ
ncbi:MAG: FecR domain-containing protein [Ginsengibacter sp.]